MRWPHRRAWLLACVLAPAVQAAEPPTGLCVSDDTRATLHAEMRALLGALHGVHVALGERDFDALAERAAAGGTAMVGQVEHQTHAHPTALPHEFVKIGLATHAAFDELAVLAREGGRPRELLPALSKVTAQCVSCHERYRLAPAAECVSAQD